VPTKRAAALKDTAFDSDFFISTPEFEFSFNYRGFLSLTERPLTPLLGSARGQIKACASLFRLRNLFP
jgi:hypothetical protein